ncbi:TIGR00282 family metallophosphoesterase [Pikeienuella sp. HZG-20]|uniref:TIGR00282 family metallophosphoesterase n=1 Tax=Paludibacillus litoralis TaxID=3133267 RepID=UPI0030EC81E7
MNLLFLGDIVGRCGRDAVVGALPGLRERLKLDFVVINGENSAGGFGMTAAIANDLFEAGADCVTLGDHAFDQKEMLGHIDTEPRILRPLNFAPAAPGLGARLFEAPRGKRVLVAVALGRLFLSRPYDNPYPMLETALKKHPLGAGADATILEFHAEATSEKMAIGQYFDGRASLVVGTHTHVPTADTMILPRGSAYQTDAGMCGDYNSVIGMEPSEPLRRFTTGMTGGRFAPNDGEATVSGVFVETGPDGRALRASPLRVGGRLGQSPCEAAG